MPQCVAFGCNNATGKTDPQANLSFHRFPLSSPDILRKWVNNMGRKLFIATQYSRLCSTHFEKTCFIEDLYHKYVGRSPGKKARRLLKPDAVPTIFTHRPPTKPRSTTVSRLKKQEKKQQIEQLLYPPEKTDEKLVSKQKAKKPLEHSPAKRRKVAETATLASEGLHPDDGQPPESTHSMPVQQQKATPTKMMPTPAYGTPRRTRLDHPYAHKTVRSCSTQTAPTPKPLEAPTKQTPSEETSTVQEQQEKPTVSTPTSILTEATPKRHTLAEPVPGTSAELSGAEDVEEETNSGDEYIPSSDSSSTSDQEKVETVGPCDEKKYVVFASNLGELLKFCSQCGSPVTELSKFSTGSMLGCNVKCHNGHSYVWHSQPQQRKQPLGNLLIASSILSTGNTYGKISDLAEALNLQFFSKVVYNKIQRENILPVVQEAWKVELTKSIQAVKKDKGSLVLAGDARCDSPGHTAKYGSYTLMHADGGGQTGTRKIVSMHLVQVSEVKNSNHMEPEGLRRCLDELQRRRVKISTLATDRHLMIGSIMKKDYKTIDHQFDTWHVGKSITKQLTAKAKLKDCTDLSTWIQSISNHLWFCCATCGGDEQLLREKWLSLLHHITNKHRWTGGGRISKCSHPTLSATDKKKTCWLKPTSPAFQALKSVVANQRILSAVGHLNKFCHTGELEVFHSMLLKFCPKRQHFTYDVMNARLMLAAMAWNTTTRRQARDSSGQTATSVVYSKRRKLFVLRNRYKNVKSDHAKKLIRRIAEVHRDKVKLPQMKRPAGLPKYVATVAKPSKAKLKGHFHSRYGQRK